MSKTLLIMAGGTGGHIMPALAVAGEMRARGWQVVWLGARGKMEETLVPAQGIALELLPVGGVRGRGWLQRFTASFEQLRAILLALDVLARHRPQVVMGFGGFTAFAGGVAAWLSRVPLVIHEQNSVAGLTNKLLARLARRVLVAFPSALGPRGEWVGNPVRREIAALPDPATRFAGRSGPLRVLVVGGSLGAQALNDVVPLAVGMLEMLDRPIITHQAGVKHLDVLRAHYESADVKAACVPFIENMAAAYAEADLVIGRSGALTIAELAAAGVGAILVPFPHAVDDHQTGNAQYLAAEGAAVLVQQAGLSPAWLAARLGEFNRTSLLKMALAARRLARTSAAADVADIVESIVEDVGGKEGTGGKTMENL